MNERVLLVDFENVQTLELSKLSDDFCITIFVGNMSLPPNGGPEMSKKEI